MSSRPAPQPSSRQAAPTQRQAPQSGSRTQTTSGSSQRQDAAATRQSSGENQGQRQDARGEAQEDRQNYAENAREDRQDYYDDWDDNWYHDDDYGEALVVGVAVGAVVAAADYDDEVTTVTNVTNVTNVTALASLPCEASITVSNGVNYYQCGSNWYTRAYQGDVVVYVPGGPPPSK
jgi:hypothetical protein